ncbi:Gfo/Idh/MocA family oxidoreductase [Luteimonas sp. SJ-92]|uniref:Gfo/Idh/MocA family oxidoreductase n=2 Tax=Luteimonas salinisoli TaxID=2752307 RepID=A0A853JDQ8_9GAMM|nr:Gfo/Idh/MocA family oxidoreductase [Luteimonas salinisoli]NZA26884.1 Gfo/Idh/MocA family oxidoreductase [Luteimonas salinisoli]
MGAGRMGQVHGPNAVRTPGLRLKYVVDPRPGAAQALAARCGAAVATLEQALDDPAVGGVLVCSSTDRHLAHALAAVDAGKAVFCEKPIDLDLDKAREAQPRFRDARFVLGFNRRYDPHFLALKRRLDAGEVGALESLQLVNHDPAAPPPGFIPTSGGLFKDFTIHDLDMARWLLGEEPTELFCAASCLVDPEIGRLGDVDTARTVLRTASGRLCVISNTRRSGYGYDQRVEAFGAAGMIAAGNVVLDTVGTLTEDGLGAAPIAPGFPQRFAASYRALLAHFAEVAQGLAPSRTRYADGIAALALAEACGQSARSGRAIRLQGDA